MSLVIVIQLTTGSVNWNVIPLLITSFFPPKWSKNIPVSEGHLFLDLWGWRLWTTSIGHYTDLGWATGQFGFDFRWSEEFLSAPYQDWPWAHLAFYRAVIVGVFFRVKSAVTWCSLLTLICYRMKLYLPKKQGEVPALRLSTFLNTDALGIDVVRYSADNGPRFQTIWDWIEAVNKWELTDALIHGNVFVSLNVCLHVK